MMPGIRVASPGIAGGREKCPPLHVRLRLGRVVCGRMKNLFSTLVTNLPDAMSLAEELVSAPGNDNMVIWLQAGLGGVTLRQEFLTAPAVPARCHAGVASANIAKS